MLSTIHGYQSKPKPHSILYEGTLAANTRTLLANRDHAQDAIRSILLSASGAATLTLWREFYNPTANNTALGAHLDSILLGTGDGRIYISARLAADWTLAFTHPDGASCTAFGTTADYEQTFAGFDNGDVYVANGITPSTWTHLHTAANSIESIAAGDIDGLYIVLATTATSSVEVSTDAGATFQTIALPVAGSAHKSLIFADTGFFMVATSKAYSSSDCLTWTDRTSTMPAGKTYDYLSSSSTTSICVAGTNHISRTTNFGASWTLAASTYPIKSIHADSNGSAVWIAGASNGTLYKSTDNGATWSALSLNLGAAVLGITEHQNDNGYWIAMTANRLSRSANDGTAWLSGDGSDAWTLHVPATLPLHLPINVLLPENSSLLAQASADLFALLLT